MEEYSVYNTVVLGKERRHSPEYLRWAIDSNIREMFFAGRSVLHRIDQELHGKLKASAVDAILKKLGDESQITILFLDPGTPNIDILAAEEGPSSSILEDIRVSLEICKELGDKLRRHHPQQRDGKLTIAVYSQNPSFAFHRQNGQIIIGFYYFTMRGEGTSFYEAIDDETRHAFEEHFLRIRDAAKKLVVFDGSKHLCRIDLTLIDELIASVDAKLARPKAGKPATAVVS